MARSKKTTGEAEGPAAAPAEMSMGARMSVPLAPSDELTAEQQGQLRSKATAAAFGEVIGALMRSPRHRAMKLQDLEKAVIPAIANGYFAIANMPVPNRPGETTPVGVILWATVSAEVDKRLSAATTMPLPIERTEWRSGDIPWVIDIVGPKEVMERLLAEVSTRAFGGKGFKAPKGAFQ